MAYDPQFSDRMLEATFEYARLAINSAILLNGAAATGLLAFGAQSTHGLAGDVGQALVLFAKGAALGGFTALLAYFGQRYNWEHSKFGPKSGAWKRFSDVATWAAIGSGVASYFYFAWGCVTAQRLAELSGDILL